MGKKKSSIKKTLGLTPGTVVYVGSKTDSELYIDVFDFNQDFIEEKELDTIEDAFSFIDTEPVSWININGLNHTEAIETVSYTHLRAHETDSYLVCRLL